MTTEERLYKLEGIVEGVMATLPGQVTSLEERVDLLRQEVKAEIGALRREVEEKFNGLRQELKGEIQSLRQEVKAETTELRGEIQSLRQEMAGLRQEVKAEINTAFNKLMLYFTALAAALAVLTFLR